MMPSIVQASECNFTRSLYVGVAPGEDIRCLQEYLNESGYTVSVSGVGAPGRETTMYADKTRATVLQWQSDNDVVGANGVFGPASRALYVQLTKDSNTKEAETQSSDDTQVQVSAARTQFDGEIGKVVNDTLHEVDQAQHTLDEREDVPRDAQRHMNKARSAILDMLFAAFNNEDSMVLLNAAIAMNQASQATDAMDDQMNSSISNSTNNHNQERAQARDALDEARGMIVDAQDKLDQADDKLDDAQDEYEYTNWANSLEDTRAAIALVRSIEADL